MGNGMNKILPGLYVGNFKDAKDEEQLTKNNITHILSIYDDARPILKTKKYLCVDASDTPGQDLMPHFRKCIKFIHKASLAGMSRSVTVTVAYIMTVTQHTWRDVLTAVKYQRSVANPNFGFVKQLEKYEEEFLVQERQWLQKKYKSNKFDDGFLIEDICKKYREFKEKNLASSLPPEKETGSCSSSYPLNKEEDCIPSSSWDKSKRKGMIYLPDSNQDQ